MANLKINELRIGNWLRIKKEIRDYRREIPVMYLPQHWDDKSIIMVNRFNLTDLEPIPLTPEILEAAGFKETQKANYVTNELSIHSLGKMHWVDTNEFQYGECFIETSIKYLHQLQNLYYSLTGQELTINLNQLQQS